MAFARACGLCLLLVAGGVAASQRGGTPPRGFEAAVDAAASLTRLRSLLVAVRGEVVEERYYRGASAARPANVKSVSKSIIGLLVGLAIDRGHIKSVRDPIARYLPPQTGAVAGKGAITIEDFLTMRSGLETTSNRNYGRWVSSGNWVRHVLQRPMVDEPGGRMIYSTGNSHILSAAITRATGVSTLEFARRALGAPLGIAIRAWTRDPQGIYLGGNEMSMTAREMLAVGQLLLTQGRRGDRQVVSERWIRESIVPRVESPRQYGRHYGYGWWLNELGGHDVIYAWGFGGQFIFAVPGLDAVIVVTSVPEPGEERREQRDAIYDIVERHILPVIAAQARGGTPTERSRLRARKRTT